MSLISNLLKAQANHMAKHTQPKHLKAEYIGGYQDQPRNRGLLTLGDGYIRFKAAFGQTEFTITGPDVKDIAIEGERDVSRRITATRLVAVGIFAFAFKKRNDDSEAFLTITDATGDEAIFYFAKTSPSEVKRKLGERLDSYGDN